MLMPYANSLDPDKAPQNVEPQLRSKLFDSTFGWKQLIFANFEQRNSMQRVKIISLLVIR